METVMAPEEAADSFVPVRRRARKRQERLMKDDAPYSAGKGDSESMDILQHVADDITLTNAPDEEQEADEVESAAPGGHSEADKTQHESSPSPSAASSASPSGLLHGGKRKELKKKPANTVRYEVRRLLVPPHRMSPLRKQWTEILEPLVTHLKLQVRMNLKRRCVELRTRVPGDAKSGDMKQAGGLGSLHNNSSLLQKGSDFVRAFLLGFEVRDAIALLRLDDLFIESFEIKDVKRLNGDHLSRCIARLNGREGKTKYAIENATRTRLVFADSRIHILGSFENIKLARHSICSLVLGAPPGKVYNHLRTVTRRLAERL
ncbi:putative pre-rRNA-processing protein PNO1 [Besnoitia besnoiti]|uniref:Putative pre-rRNA-processing protein PNO1 n=1 Tax=Besnoitia besnoiti TaxID=94643 RepID=A0A2A9MKP4_BESBE|nr:putative pre-rRNA-processing protein PNO1 [Besnoitia besnoiti]PFH36566.1 putative pre-rRNA-processing protein PNO1 [Besnoitia besnoiti]